MSAPAAEFRKLPLRKVVRGAFSLCWEHRGALFRATQFPLLAAIACSLAWGVSDPNRSVASNLVLSTIHGLVLSWLAITVHRLVLLNEPEAHPDLDAVSLRRLAIFFGVALVMWVLYQALTMLITGVILSIIHPPKFIPTGTTPDQLPERMSLPFSPQWIVNFAAFVAYWIAARLSLMLPAIALDLKPDLVAAWRASRRNGWRLAVVIGVLPWCLKGFMDLLYRDGATSAEYGILVVLATLLVIVEVVALSLSYWELTSPSPPPTPPLS